MLITLHLILNLKIINLAVYRSSLYNGEKIITNCGSAKNFSDNLSIISQSTAAHSVITINDTSSCLSQQNKLIKKYFGNSLKRKLKVYKKDIMKSKHFATYQLDIMDITQIIIVFTKER